MSSKTLNGEQAIFTSVRTPMGEGYRIIAASRGLGAKEKQIITRRSPSHDGLCETAGDDQQQTSPSPREGSGEHQSPSPREGLGEGLACTFYPLSEGRHCVALSCRAGAEHTGRGGQRIYTHSVVITEEDLRSVGYNPFVVLRAMLARGFHEPQLKPPQILPPAELEITDRPAQPARLALHESLQTAHRCRLLDGLLAGRTYVVNVAGNWLESAEAMILGIPGPQRSEISFGAGVRFSVGRIGRLNLLHDDTQSTKAKLTGQRVEYLDPAADAVEQKKHSDWVAFVERHWQSGDSATLARRTSRNFTDCTPPGLNRIAGLYDRIDQIEEQDSIKLLGEVRTCFAEKDTGTEAEIAQEYLDTARTTLLGRIKTTPWSDLERLCNVLVETAKSHQKAMPFAAPLIDAALRIAMRDDPISAARTALGIVPTSFANTLATTSGNPRPTTNTPNPTGVCNPKPATNTPNPTGAGLFIEVLENLHRYAKTSGALDATPILQLCDRWSIVDVPQHQARKQELINEIRQSCAVESPSN